MKKLYPFFIVLSVVYLALSLLHPLLFIQWGWSWTVIYLVPLLLPALTILWALLIFVFTGSWKNKWHFALLLNAGLLSAYLYQHPVYQGDLSDGGVNFELPLKNHEAASWKSEGLKKPFLIVFVDYNCPHCKEAVQKLNLLKQRTPEANIWVSLVQEEEEYIEKYQKKTGAILLHYKLNAHPDAAELYQHRFPTFILSAVNENVIWSNNDMGALAWDRIESALK